MKKKDSKQKHRPCTGLKKALNIMKLTTLLLFIGFIQVSAISYSQATRLNLKFEKEALENVFNKIEGSSEFSIFYKNELIKNSGKITGEFKNALIFEILDQLLKPENLAYSVKDRLIIIVPKEGDYKELNSQQQKSVTGNVTDKTGAPLAGVSVTQKGTSTGAITDVNGRFFFPNIPPDATLQFSFIGMKTQEIKVENQGIVLVILEQELLSLDEVVVVGYGITRKKDLTSSVTTINSKEFNQGAQTNVMQLIQGKVPGLNITKDGNPSGSTAIILRGQSTLRTGEAQEPLYVVDGIPGGIFQLDDIVSIDILRDASAAAIYGSRAANGVIVVTTKRGEEGNSKISYNAYTGIETISNKIDMMSADQYRSFISENKMVLDPGDDDGVSTDWLKECTRTGVSMNHNISMGGGNGKATYFGSATYKKVDGIIKETGVNTLSLNLDVQQKAINDKLTVGLTLANTVSDHKLLPVSPTKVDNGGDPDEFMLNMINYLPTESVKQADGSYTENEHSSAYNPVALLQQNSDNRRDKDFLGNLSIKFNILKGLDYDMNVSYKNGEKNRSVYYGKESRLAQGYNGLAMRNVYENQTKLLESYLTFSKVFGSHDLKLMGGYSWQEDRTNDGFQSTNDDFVSDETGANNLTLGSGYNIDYGSTGKSVGTLRMISFFSRLNYAYKGKYLLQATVRRDGSSAFGSNNRWGYFPSVSLGWKITEESFMKNQNIFNNLKLRAAYGISGNSLGFDPLISKLRYSSTGLFYYNEDYIKNITPTQNANNDLRWESTTMTNLGLDFSLLKGRISGTIEYYDKVTKDLIWSYAVSSTEYYVTSLTTNVGEMENKGIEFTLNVTPVSTKDFTWTTTFNVSSNKNRVNSLSNDEFTLDYIKEATSIGEHGQSGNYAQLIEAGHPIGQFYLWKYAGHNASGISQFYAADGSLTTTPGADDHFYAGSAQPKATGGWNNTLSYKNLTLDFMFRGVVGNKILNATRADLNYPTSATLYNMPLEVLDEPINDTGASYTSSRYIEKGDYLRLDNITLAYSFSLNSPVVKKLRVYSTANNVLTITGYKGLDPEVYMGGITPGIDNQNFYPKTRTFMFGVNIDF
jgi:TonB-linked SusC/RagA family outer membrane protein